MPTEQRPTHYETIKSVQAVTPRAGLPAIEEDDAPVFVPSEQPVEGKSENKSKAAENDRIRSDMEAWDQLLKALFRPNVYGDILTQPPAGRKKAEEVARAVAKDFPKIDSLDKSVLLRSATATIQVEAKKITFGAAPLEDGKDPVFTIESARAMALLASQNPRMIEKGIRLKGTEEQQALLRQAVAEINEGLEEGCKLRIAGEPVNKPAPVFSPMHSSIQSSMPQSVAAMPVDSVVLQPVEKNNTFEVSEQKQQPASAETSAAPNDELATPAASAEPAQAAAEEGVKTKAKRRTPSPRRKKPVEAPAQDGINDNDRAPHEENTVPTAAAQPEKKSLLGRLGYMAGHVYGLIAARKTKSTDGAKKSMDFDPARRMMMFGGAAAVATTVMFAPTAAEAGEKRGFWATFLRGGPGRVAKDNKAKEVHAKNGRKPETKKQKAARLRREAAEKKAQEKAEKARQQQEAAKKKKEHSSWKKEAKKVEKNSKKAREWLKPKPKTIDPEKAKPPKKTLFAFLFGGAAAKAKPGNPLKGVFNAKSGGVTLYHRHTGETYFLDFSRMDSKTTHAQLNRFLRDHYSGAVANMDRRLGYYLRDISVELGARQIDIVSAYRTVKTNTQVLGNSSGSNSQHCVAKALDIAVNGVKAKKVHQAALNVGCDGIGYYPPCKKHNGFVHVDCRGHAARW